MRFLTRIIEHIRPKETKIPFGRWRPEDCVKQMNNKIDLSNEDHCGPCGQYALEKRVYKKDKKTFTDINQELILKYKERMRRRFVLH